jgi:uncharacterized protein (TIGR02266 family)
MDSSPIVVPVRFSGGGVTMQSTTSRMGPEGVFVRGLVSPRVGVEITLLLSLPGERVPLQLAGTVAEVVPSGTAGKEAGFWVRFKALEAGLRRNLDSLLARRRAVQPTSQPVERRTFARAPARFSIRWSSKREFLAAYAENISRGGVFMATENPPPLREVIELQLDLPDGEPPARTQAEVVQRTTVEEARASGRVAGAGMQFIGADDEFRRRLDACIAKLK